MKADNSAHRKYQFAKRQFDDFNETLSDFERGAVSARRLERYWRELLTNFVSTYKALRNFYIAAGAGSKADSIEKEINSDPILYYLFQSRNSESHVAEAVEGVPTTLGLNSPAGVVNLFSGDNMNIRFVGNSVIDQFGNRHALPNFSGRIDSGNFRGTISDPTALILTPPYLRLLPAKNRNQEYPVPQLKATEGKMAESAARHARGFLEKWHADARTQLGLEN